MKRRKLAPQFVVCVDSEGYRTSLVVRCVYPVLDDAEASGRGLLRVIDESGEDYLYPRERFAAVELSEEARKRLARALFVAAARSRR